MQNITAILLSSTAIRTQISKNSPHTAVFNIMPQNVNYEQNWWGTGAQANAAESTISFSNTTIQAEPQSNNINEFESNHKNHSTLLVQRTESNLDCTGSDEAIKNHQNMYYNDTFQYALVNGSRLHRPLGFNPLTAAGYPNVCMPRALTDMSNGQEQMHPSTTSRRFSKNEPTFISAALTPNHISSMGQAPPKSQKMRSDASKKDCTDLDNSSMSVSASGENTKPLYSDYNQEISMQKVNLDGKIRTHKCIHCDNVYVTKKDFWEHLREHIKPERQIQCAKCPFVTDQISHYDYHLRNHEGLRPFTCSECNYSYVNKSNLNKHLKSHPNYGTNMAEYRCKNCFYFED